jgi:hypothetical protein
MVFRTVRLRYTLLLLLRHFMAARIQHWWPLCYFRWRRYHSVRTIQRWWRKQHGSAQKKIARVWRKHKARSLCIARCFSDAHIATFCVAEENKYGTEYECDTQNRVCAYHVLKQRGVRHYAYLCQLLLQCFMMCFHRNVWDQRHVHDYIGFPSLCRKAEAVVKAAKECNNNKTLESLLLEYKGQLRQWKMKCSWMKRFVYMVHTNFLMLKDHLLPTETFTSAFEDHCVRCGLEKTWVRDVWYPRIAAVVAKPPHYGMSFERGYYERLHVLGSVGFRFHGFNMHGPRQTERLRAIDFKIGDHMQDCARKQILEEVTAHADEIMVVKLAVANAWLRCRDYFNTKKGSYPQFIDMVLITNKKLYMATIEEFFMGLVPDYAEQQDYPRRAVKERILPALMNITQAPLFYLTLLKCLYIMEDLLLLLADDRFNERIKAHPMGTRFLTASDEQDAKAWFRSLPSTLACPFKDPPKKKPLSRGCERVALCFTYIISDFDTHGHMAPAWDKERLARCAKLFRETLDKMAELVAPHKGSKHCKTRIVQLRFANAKAEHRMQCMRLVYCSLLSAESIDKLVAELDWVTFNVTDAMVTCIRETVALANVHFRVFGPLYTSAQ